MMLQKCIQYFYMLTDSQLMTTIQFMTTRRLREKEERRQEIIAAAEQVFFSKGLDNSTMDDIAVASELSKGLLYFYFKNKEALCLAIVVRAFQALHFSIVEATATGKTTHKLTAVIEVIQQFYLQQNDYFNMLTYYDYLEQNTDASGGQAKDCFMARDAIIRHVASIISEGVREGVIGKAAKPMSYAFAFVTLGISIVQKAYALGHVGSQYYGVQPEEEIQSALELLVAGISAKAKRETSKRSK